MENLQTFLVGGAVRDRLMGLEPKDLDYVVVGSTPEEMLSLGFTRVGASFPVFLHPETGDEYALARTERSTGAGHNDFAVEYDSSVTLEDDLIRRDLTINAMAMDADGNVIDPYGGQKDLADKVVRHTSNAFMDDPLRVLRAVRFAARYDFAIDNDTWMLMEDMIQRGDLDHLVPERVFGELEKGLMTDNPDVYLSFLQSLGALKVILPEVDALYGVPQPALHHPEIDTGSHIELCLLAAAKADANSVTRFAVLMHDLGKGITPEDELPQHRGHEQAGVPLVEAVCDRLKVPNAHREAAVKTCELHLKVHRVFESRGGTVIKLVDRLGGMRQNSTYEDVLDACEFDAKGRYGFSDRDYPQGQFLRDVVAVIKGVDTQELVDRGFKGKQFGELLFGKRVHAVKHFMKKYPTNGS